MKINTLLAKVLEDQIKCASEIQNELYQARSDAILGIGALQNEIRKINGEIEANLLYVKILKDALAENKEFVDPPRSAGP